MDRRAKIVATIGPASESEDVLEKMLRSGMDVARFNFSHGTHQLHAARTIILRSLAKRLLSPLAIMQDLQGPKIRVGLLTSSIMLEAGKVVHLIPGEHHNRSSSRRGQILDVPVDFPELFKSVNPSDRILLDDGRLDLRVQAVGRESITAEVITGGELTSHKGINLPGVRLNIPAFTEKDADDLKFGLSLGVDAVALSFVQTANDVKKVKKIVKAFGEKSPLLIAKLERPTALENLEAILKVVDGVMVARGDMGVEMAPELVPGAQKHIIQEANRAGKIVITATQMLESMIHAPLPTRAEASDVANAVYDGTDAVMLSAETAVGEYPVESIMMMDRIIRRAEADADKWGRGQVIETSDHDDALAIARAARELAHDRDVEAIVVFTRTGRTASLMSKQRPCVPVLAFTPVEETYRRMSMVWGVTPYRVPFADTVEAMIEHVEAVLKESNLVYTGGQVVLVSGFPVRDFRQPNMALLHTVR